MKSELRTELKSNLLADRLEEVILAIKPYLKLIGFSIAALIIAAIVYAVIRTNNEKASAEAWSELYFAANQSEKLDSVHSDFPSTSAGLWAKQKSADALLAQALEQVYIDRDLSDKLLKEARGAYRAVLGKAAEPMLISRATLGLAQVLDSEGNAAEAAREFKKLLTLSGTHPEMIADAQRHLEFIDSDDGRAFYEWFKTNRPTAPKPVDIPKNLGNLPNLPDLEFSSPAAPTNMPGKPDASSTTPAIELPPPADKPLLVEPPMAKPEAAGTKPPALESEIKEPKTEVKAEVKAESPSDTPVKLDTPKSDKPTADKPAADKPTADKPKESSKKSTKKSDKSKKDKSKADDSEIKIPPPEPSASEKQAGSS